MSFQLSNSLVLDGYRLIRFLGRGGFGEVWLCRSESMGDYRALKFIPTHDSERLEKEYDSLLHYRKAAARLRSPHLVPIEHVNRNEAGLYYVLPLADGSGADDPADPAWVPLSLAARIHERAEMSAWFSSQEIIGLLLPVLEALQTLSDASLVHRDVKPENILFFNGLPCLGDISLLGADASVITRRGTPGYATPSWYVGGHPDMYGVAATLFTLLTGNSPDRMGRAAFVWPPQGERALPEAERADWKRLHAVIRRATDEKVSERFVDFTAMVGSLQAVLLTGEQGRKRRATVVLGLSLALIVCAAGWMSTGHNSSSSQPEGSGPAAAATAAAPAAAALAVSRPTESSPPATTSAKQREHADLAYVAINIAFQGVYFSPYNISDSNEDEYLPIDASDLQQVTLGALYDCIEEEQDLDIPTALLLLDECLDSIPSEKNRPNLQLARLLLQQCADENAVSPAVFDAPFFRVLGNDSLDIRVALLCALGAAEVADKIIGDVIAREIQPAERSEAFFLRAQLSAELGRFEDARVATEQSVALAGDDRTIKAKRQMDIVQLKKEIPAYADYLKSLPEN